MREGCLGELEEGNIRAGADKASSKVLLQVAESLKGTELEGLCTLEGEATLRRELRVKSGHPSIKLSQVLPLTPLNWTADPLPSWQNDSHFLLEIERWVGLLKSREAAQCFYEEKGSQHLSPPALRKH